MIANSPYPYFARSGMKRRVSSTQEELSTYLHIYTQQKDADSQNRAREQRNQKVICNDIVAHNISSTLSREGRTEENFNIIKHVIHGHLGNIQMNWVNPRWHPREGDPLESVEALTKVWMAWKEHYNYKRSAFQCFQSGYVYRGVEELYIAMPSVDPREWAVAFRPRRSDLTIMDQNVSSHAPSRDARQCHFVNYVSPSRLLNTFPNQHDDILASFQRMEKVAPLVEAPRVDLFETLDNQFMGTNLKVIERLHLKDERKTRQMVTDMNHPMVGTLLPESGYSIGTVEDVAFKQAWAAQNNIEINDDIIGSFTEYVPTLWTTTFCPNLSLVLENRRDMRQLGGHLPVYCWSFFTYTGLYFGLIDYLYDLQQDFNNRRLAKTKILTKTPIAGKVMLREEMFEGDKTRMQKAVQDMTDSSVPLVLPEGAPTFDQCVSYWSGTQLPSSILQDESFSLNLAEIIGSLPPAMQGRSERQADSGVAIGRKVIEGTIMQRSETETILQHENDKAEDWTISTIKLLSHPVHRNRMFKSGDGQEEFRINEVRTDVAGNPVIRNNIAALKRPQVVISETKENVMLSQVRRETAVAGLQSMAPTDTNIGYRAAMEHTLVVNQDFSTDEIKEKTVRAADMQFDAVMKRLELQNLDLDKQLERIKAPPQAPGGMPGQPQLPGPSGGGGGAPGGGPPQIPGGGPPQGQEEPRPPVPDMERVA